ncbi:copper chaperone PCu(A)C [Amycolatopsis aidingensis]|uniref:copper chaperone PCu(A)C n=1 Tax=Amycolatopsis aidingensis TaxID=2842453 RepID=UPI001C0D52F5|nr:copper chaperone PCu(A)C [Amycolatopsis aidingensis]
MTGYAQDMQDLPKARPAAACAAMALAVTACGNPAPLEDEQLATVGTNGSVGQVELRNVYVQRPLDGAYQTGEDARVLLTMVNSAERPDRLAEVTSGYAEKAMMRWDRNCDGTAEQVEAIPLTAGGTVPAPDGKAVTGHLPYHVELVSFDRKVRAGTTVPVTFAFERAGQTTLDVKVQPVHPADQQPRRACT